jgi:putative nucleotidyltransferase with HDIG domain
LQARQLQNLLTMFFSSDGQRAGPDPELRPASVRLREGRSAERSERLVEARASYEAAIALAATSGERAVRVEALRRLGVVCHRQNEGAQARDICRQSYAEAIELGDVVLAGEALNALAGFEFESGEIGAARGLYQNALDLAGSNTPLSARIEQNLGILASLQGDHSAACQHYRRSLSAFEGAGDERGCALAHHHLGMIASRRGELDEAERAFQQSAAIAARVGDVQLRGRCELNRAEVCHGRQQYAEAMRRAETALEIFERMGDRLAKADAYRVIGMVFRDTGRPLLAEARLRASVGLASESSSLRGQAEASRELARLSQTLGRNQEALTLLKSAHDLFRKLDARSDLVDVGRKTAELEGAFLALVREWGESIESADHYTFGHCERVADYAVTVAEALGLDAMQQTTIRLGAYLHDVGKVRVPHEVLNKPGRLSDEEFELMKLHPVYGVELLAGVEFPWDLKPIIRWHHEKLDGTGYPDRLRGEEIPRAAQIIGIVDVYDALTTDRSYRAAMPRASALAEMERCRGWWFEDVFAAFMGSIGIPERSLRIHSAA